MFYKVLHTEIKAVENPHLTRAFQYGDGFFETMFVHQDKIPLFEYHYQRILKSFEILKLDTAFLPSSEALYEKMMETILVKNNYRVRVDFTRESEGLYTPERNDVVFSIAHKVLDFAMFEHTKTSYKLGLYEENKKAISPISSIKSKNALIYVLAGIWAKEHHYDDAIILNQNSHVCECISSNIFIIKDAIIYTPAKSEGQVDGVMRSYIIKKLTENNYTIIEKSISVEEVKNADEVFVCNGIQGIQAASEVLGITKNTNQTQEIIMKIKIVI